ncbi:MAG: C4-type zinc ribbon domain-containing protein [Prevotella sp.]|nr:C4-type zinc ribbon domain-containing protein [Prevotella sp.]
MAKKIKEMSVEEKLKALYQLQATLSAIDEKRALRGELPLEVEDLEDEVAGLATRIEKINNEIEEIRKAVAQRRNDIELAKASVERYKMQLNEVSNNRQYDTLTKEIEFQELEIDHCQKKIKDADLKVAERMQDCARAEQTITERKKDLEMKRAELDEIMSETRAEEEQLREKADDLELRIEPRLLQSFKRIRKNARNGLGVVYVQRDACGGCFNKIPPQRQLDIKMHKKIIVCEYCGRILVDPELAGVKMNANGEEKPKKKRTIRKRAVAADTQDKA